MDPKKEDEKELFPVTSSRWNSNIEKNIKEIGESCKGYKWMNITSAKSTMKKYNIIIFFNICVGPLAALFGAVLTVSDSLVFPILIMVCGFFGGVLGSIVKYSKFQERSMDHKTTAAKYASLEGNVRRQLSLYRDDRVNAGKYLQWISVSFDDLFAGSPLISDSVYNEWVKFAQQKNFFVPREYGLVIEANADENIRDLYAVEEIRVNGGESPKKDIIKQQDSSTFKIEIAEKRPLKRGQTKRTSKYTTYLELNRYGDKEMQYELSRMFGFQK